MLGSSLGFFSSKGMTTVPDLSGLSKSEAEAAITAAFLTNGGSTSQSSSNSSLDNKTFGQSLSAGSIVDYEESITFSYYTYVAPAPSPTPVVCDTLSTQNYPINWSGNCVDGQESGTQVVEISYTNCPTVTNTTTVYRSCGSTPSCTGGGTETFSTCGECVGGTQTCNYYSERYYDNCPSVITSYSYSQGCGTPPPPPPPPPGVTPSVNWPPGTPANQCVDADTKIIVVKNNVLEYVAAKNVNVGDYVLAMTWDELVDQNIENFMSATSSNLTNIDTLPTMVVAKYEYEKPTTMYINNDIETRMSLEQPMLVNRDGIWQWKHSGDIFIGDKFIQYVADDQVIEVEIFAVDYIQEMRDVYSFNCEDTDTFFAGNVLVHNK